jgi:glycosyltransferase involved in cell wall biosynthesis
MLRIILETSVLNFNRAGTARVAHELQKALLRHAPPDMVIQPLPPLPTLTAVQAGLSRKLFVLYWELLYIPYILPWRVRRAKGDLLHCLAPLPLARRAGNIKIITMMYDLIPFTHPHWFTAVMTYRLQRWMTQSAHYSDHFNAISQFTKTELCSHLHIPPERITVTYLGKPERQHETAVLPTIPFLLTVGTIEPRKNLTTVLQAYALARQNQPQIPRLLIVGQQGWGQVQLIQQIETLGLSAAVELAGYVADDALMTLYQQAAMLIYPSLQEGFGLPPLEAMAWGCPVITTNTGALPEVVGQAALLIDPADVTALAHAIEQVWTDKQQAATMRQQGQQQAALFSWQRCASETLAMYRQVVQAQ